MDIDVVITKLKYAEEKGSVEYEKAQNQGRNDIEEAKKQAEIIIHKAKEDSEQSRTQILAAAASEADVEKSRQMAEAQKTAEEILNKPVPEGLTDELATLVYSAYV